MELRELQAEAGRIAALKGYHEGVTVAEELAMIGGEAHEAIGEWRRGHGANEVYVADGRRQGVPVEVADAVIRCLTFAAHHGLDLASLVRLKLDENRARPWKGGKVRL